MLFIVGQNVDAANLGKTQKTFYNNRVISRALIGSFLSLVRVETEKKFNLCKLSAVKLSTFWPMRFSGLF